MVLRNLNSPTASHHAASGRQTVRRARRAAPEPSPGTRGRPEAPAPMIRRAAGKIPQRPGHRFQRHPDRAVGVRDQAPRDAGLRITLFSL